MAVSAARSDGAIATPPLTPSAGILSDVSCFLLRRPAVNTLLTFNSESEREEYSHRIMQRVGIGVSDFAILNIHQIGVEAPVAHVFEELMRWDGNSIWWPNHLATVTRIDGNLEHMKVILFGRGSDYPRVKKSAHRPAGFSLFDLKALRILGPTAASDDNARYLLYECHGGYPVGVFVIYARSRIADRGEQERTQLFFAVSFNFYGKKNWRRGNPIDLIWETIHNRASAHIMGRLKSLCEWRFRRLCDGNT
jgi:hypothetical protein